MEHWSRFRGPIYTVGKQRASAPEGEDFYAYLDSRDREVFEGQTAPSGRPLPSDHPAHEGRFGRLRMSIVPVDAFKAVEKLITPLQPRGATAAQRDRRRAELRDYLPKVRLEVMDLHVSHAEGFEPRVRRQTAIGCWCWVRVEPVKRFNGLPPVMVGDPDVEAEDRRYGLIYLRRVTREELVRLRQVFSLAHIGDADEDDDPEGAPEPGPLPPDDTPPQSSAPRAAHIRQHIHVIEVVSFAAEAEQAEPEVEYSYASLKAKAKAEEHARLMAGN